MFNQALLLRDQNWWNSKKHVNWQYEEFVLSYCLTGICTWAAADTSPDIFANNEFRGFVPSTISCNLSGRGLFLFFFFPPRNGNPTRKWQGFWKHWPAEDKLDQLYSLEFGSICAAHIGWHPKKWVCSFKSGWLKESLLIAQIWICSRSTMAEILHV